MVFLSRRILFQHLLRSSRITPSVTRQRKMSSNAAEDEVLFKVENNVGIMTMNRPKAMNSLTLNMVRIMYKQMKTWENQVKLVIIEGAGDKAFCAGGDVRAVTEVRGAQLQKDFFKEEYYLNHLIGTFKIPYVALIHGIVMGGGVGVSVHAPFRVATEKTLFAMPETAIGLVPDVGGGHFLPRLQGQLGMYLALTGHRLKGSDVIRAGVATHGCKFEDVPKLREALVNVSGANEVQDVLDSFHKDFPLQDFSMADKMKTIDEAFGKNSVEEIVDSLKAGDDWSKKTAGIIAKMSPTSLKVTFRQVREGAKKNLGECLATEYRLVRRCCEDNDFYEGVRAVLVDKDNVPKWNPPTLEEVSDSAVDRYFSRLPEDEEIKFE